MALTPLPAGMRGSAIFSEDNKHREELTRSWGGARPGADYALWLCANPSKAGHDLNDPTVGKVVKFTARCQLKKFVLMNACTYISTDPKGLLTADPPAVAGNVANVLRRAEDAFIIILAFGKMHPKVAGYASHLVSLLRDRQYELWCLGENQDGTPRHPLYLWDQTKFVRYERYLHV